MKRLLSGVAALVLLTVTAFPQGSNSNQILGANIASNYGQWTLRTTAAVASGAATLSFQPSACANVKAGGKNFFPLAKNAPITITDANTETVTPTAVTWDGSTCSVSVTLSNAHGANAPVTSGTGGAVEAQNDLPTVGGTVEITPDFAGTSANIAAAPISGVVAFEDLRTAVPVMWVARPSAATLIAAPSAPVVTVATGSLSSGAYRVTAAYVDCAGGISADSTDSTQTATTTGLSIASPAASTGACGWLPRITAAGGGTGTEILAKQTIDSTICALSQLETVVPACAIGATATVTAANPSSTSKAMVEPNAFSTYTYQQFTGAQALPPPFVNSYPFGVFVATATLNNSNADAAQFQIPAGYLNRLGATFEVCVKGGTATQVASSILTLNFNFSNNYGQSPVTVSTVAYPTQTQAAAGTFEGCVRFVTSTTGASGKFFAHSVMGSFHNFLNTVPGTQVVSADASAAQSSALDLTKVLYASVNLAGTGSANITVPIINSMTVLPIQ